MTTFMLGSGAQAVTLPKGGALVAGSAGIAASGVGATITQASQRAIIDWNSFSISAGAWVRFVQPNASSAILNRVTGGDPSRIYGAIKANGQVFVINPNGVVVGPSGTIQAATFVASTLDMSNAAFMAGGALDFSGHSAAAAQNLGFVQAADGDVVLIGRSVENAGTLQAPQGDVALAAGSEVLFQPSSDARVVVQAGLPTGGTGVDNAGAIKAAQAEIVAAGGNAYALAVNAGGMIEAVGIAQKDGRVVLTAGGGDVQVTGQVRAQNADGSGGLIQVGGGSRGQDASIPDAANVTVARSATLNANAAARGDGGQVTVWSNAKTIFAGQITATGGADGGNGGQVEVSGGYEDFIGQVDTRAAHGVLGSLLLDPDSAIIDTNPSTLTNSSSGSTTTYAASQIENLLANADVTLVTNTSVSGGSGDITIVDTSGRNSTFTLSNFTGNLLIQAANNLNINVPVSINAIAPSTAPNAQTTGTVTFQAGQNIAVNAPLNMTVSAVGVDGGSNASATLGAVSLLATNGSIDFTAQAPITLAATAQGGNVTLTGSGISVNANAGGSATVAFNGLTLQAGDGLNLSAPIAVSLGATGGGSASGYHTNAVDGGAATITPGLIDLAAGSGALDLSAALNVTLSATGGAGADVSNDGYANVGAGGAATVGPWPSVAPWASTGVAWSPGIALSGASIALGSTSGGASGTVAISAAATGGPGGAAGYDDTLVSRAGGLGGQAVVDAPGVNFDSLGAFNLPSGATLRSTLTASAGAQGTPYNGVYAFGGPASASAGNVNITAASAVLAGGVSFMGAASDGGALSQGGSVEVSSLNVLVNAGNITLSGSMTSSATYDGASTNAGLPPSSNFIFSGGDFTLGASGDILSNVSPSLAAYAGVAASSGAASLSSLDDITLTAGDSVLMPGAVLALPLTAFPAQTKLVIAADTAGTAGQPGGVTGAIDLLGAALPTISPLSSTTGPNVSIWGVDNSLMNLGVNYPAATRGAYLGNMAYAPGDSFPGVHCRATTCSAPALTITASSVTGQYGASLPAFTATYGGLVYGDGGVGSANDNITGLQFTTNYRLTGAQLTPNVGSYNITPGGAATPTYYGRPTYVGGALTITAVPLTVTANNAAMTYGGAAPTLGDTISGLVNGDTAAALGTLTVTNAQAITSNAGTYNGVITASGASDPNYQISYVPGALTINPAPLLITANNAAMTYGGVLPSLTASYGTVVNGVVQDGLVNGDTPAAIASLGLTTAATSHSNAGTYAVTASGASDPNYAITYAQGSLTVNPAPLTITASALKDYGPAAATYSSTYTGLVNGDTAAALGPLAYTTTVSLNSPVGTYANAVTASGANDRNYAVTYAAGRLTIAPFGALTITANNTTIDYGSALPNFTASYAGLLPSDTSAVVAGLKFETTAYLGANVGTYQIIPYGASAPTYYNLVYVDGVLTVAPAPLTVTANNAAMTYGGATMPSLGVTVSGLVEGDTAAQVVSVDPTTTAHIGANAGTYSIFPNATLFGPNYQLIQVNGVFTVNPAPLTITADNAAMTYGGVTPAFAATFAGLVNGDTSGVIRNLAFSSLGGSTAHAGSYAIVANGGTDSNYAFSYVPGTLTIDPAPLTITADNAAMTFGAAVPKLADSVSGLVNGDSVGNVVALAPATSATSTSNVGVYPIVPGAQLLSKNYTLALTDGTLSVNPATLTLALDSASVTRGDTPQSCSSGCGVGQATSGVGAGTSVYASQYTDPVTSDTLVWTASGFAGGDNGFSGAPTLKGDGVTTAYTFAKGSFSVSKNYVVDLVQPTGSGWLNVADPPLVVTTGTIYVIAQNPMQPPPYAFSGLRGSDASLNGQDLSSNQFSYTTNVQLDNAYGGTYQVTPAGPSLYYPVPGDPYGPYSVTYAPGSVVVLPTATPPPGTTTPSSAPSTRSIKAVEAAQITASAAGVPRALSYPGVSDLFGIPVAFGLQIDTVVGMYLASQNAPHDQRAIDNWIAANGGSSGGTGDIEPFLIQYLSNVETYQTASPAQQAQIVNAIGHVPSSSDYQLDTMICNQLLAARTQAAKKANADYQTWLNQQSALASNNRTLTSLFGQLVAPPTSILAEAEAGISAPTNVSVANLAAVAAGAAAASGTAAIFSSGSSSTIVAISMGYAQMVGRSGVALAADVVGGLATGPLIIVTAAASIAIQGIIATVEAQEFPGKLAAATQQAETYHSITQLMGSTAGQVGVATDLAGILAAGLPGGTTPASGT